MSLKADDRDSLTLIHNLPYYERAQKVMGLLRETEAGVRALLRSRQWREASRVSQGQALPQAVRDQLAFPVALPAPFLRASVHGFHVRRPAAPASSIRPVLAGQGMAEIQGSR